MQHFSQHLNDASNTTDDVMSNTSNDVLRCRFDPDWVRQIMSVTTATDPRICKVRRPCLNRTQLISCKVFLLEKTIINFL